MKYFAPFFLIILISTMLFGCDANRVRPSTAGEVVIDAYGTLEKAAAVTTQLLRARIISVERAKQVRSQIGDAYLALNAGSAALVAGDLSTSVAKLELAKTIVDQLNAFVLENQSKVPPPTWNDSRMWSIPTLYLQEAA